MTEQDLVTAGYRQYHTSTPSSNADRFYQRVIRSPDGRSKLYFINVEAWDFGKFERFPKDQNPIRFTFEVHLYRGRDRCYQLKISAEDNDTVGDIEREFAGAYAALGCVPDLYNNDGEES